MVRGGHTRAPARSSPCVPAPISSRPWVHHSSLLWRPEGWPSASLGRPRPSLKSKSPSPPVPPQPVQKSLRVCFSHLVFLCVVLVWFLWLIYQLPVWLTRAADPSLGWGADPPPPTRLPPPLRPRRWPRRSTTTMALCKSTNKQLVVCKWS